MPYLLRDMGAILLPLHKVLELFLHLLSIPGPKMFGFVYEGGIRSPLFHAQDNPLTKHYLDDHILFFILPAYKDVKEPTASNTIPIEPRSKRSQGVCYPPSTRPLQSCRFKSQDRAHLFDKQTFAPKQLQQATTLRGRDTLWISSSSITLRQPSITSFFPLALNGRLNTY